MSGLKLLLNGKIVLPLQCEIQDTRIRTHGVSLMLLSRHHWRGCMAETEEVDRTLPRAHGFSAKSGLRRQPTQLHAKTGLYHRGSPRRAIRNKCRLLRNKCHLLKNKCRLFLFLCTLENGSQGIESQAQVFFTNCLCFHLVQFLDRALICPKEPLLRLSLAFRPGTRGQVYTILQEGVL